MIIKSRFIICFFIYFVFHTQKKYFHSSVGPFVTTGSSTLMSNASDDSCKDGEGDTMSHFKDDDRDKLVVIVDENVPIPKYF